ncbi:MAG: nitrous oxide reductase family maturation protein NosD [Planctomycetes bacterium]|nr:nitrous oxide reductase family maturation protein NosD [Planctomycetota bacterium]
MRTTPHRVLVLSLLCLLGGCGEETGPSSPRRAAPARPAEGREVPAGAELQALIDAALPGDVLCLAPGSYAGPLAISKPLTLWGPADAVIHARSGSTIVVKADRVALLGFTVEGSGQRFDLMEGGLSLTGSDLRVEGVTVRDALFGIMVLGCKRAHLAGNTVIGTGIPAMGLRGDGIRLWETEDSVVEENQMRDSRDLVVWYSSRNTLRKNEVRRSRYGTHFMYSHGNTVEDSAYVDNEVGVFAMYSRDLVLRRNLLARSGGAAGLGLGLKEAGNVTAEDNWILANTVGIYVDASPLDPSHVNVYRRNTVRYSETALSLHAAVKRTEVRENVFRDNGSVVQVGGGGDALKCRFEGNYYDSYQGYDLDGDGRGDVPFEFRRLSTQLEGRYPELALLHGAPAMSLVDIAGEVLPLFAPKRLLTDEAPRVVPIAMTWTPEARHAH